MHNQVRNGNASISRFYMHSEVAKNTCNFRSLSVSWLGNSTAIKPLLQQQLITVMGLTAIGTGAADFSKGVELMPRMMPVHRLSDDSGIVYRSAIALKLAPLAQLPALDIANQLVASFPTSNQNTTESRCLDFSVEVVSPGWINFRLSEQSLATWLQHLVQIPPWEGRGRGGERERGRGGDGERGRWGEREMGRGGDGEMGRAGDGERGRWGEREMGRAGDGESGRWGEREMGRAGDGERGRWGEGEMGRGGDDGNWEMGGKSNNGSSEMVDRNHHRQLDEGQKYIQNLFLVQYVHARCCSLLRLAHRQSLIKLGDLDFKTLMLIEPHPIPWLNDDQKTDTGQMRLQLVHPAERRLIAQILDVLDEISDLEQRHLAKLAIALCNAFENFDSSCRIWGEVKTQTPKLAQARLGLVGVTQASLRSLLQDQLGVPAPVEL